MALIHCPECGAKLSNRAKACVHCGYPMPEIAKKIGGIVSFGNYPQTSDGNDNTAIQWLVQDFDEIDNKILLISRYALDVQLYNTENTDTSWEKCSLRAWLNSIFMNRAFTEQEQKNILVTDVDIGNRYIGWNLHTQDKIFLLSYAETWMYFDSCCERECAPTAYAIAQGALINKKGNVDWWLRDTGDQENRAVMVDNEGMRFVFDPDVDTIRICVRPAVWIKMDSNIL